MPTFLHTADIHLDTAFSAHFDMKQAEIRRNEMLRCVSDMIDAAKNLDILLIAGDLFDSEYVSYETVSFLKRKFSEISDTRVFICGGNHDPYTQASVYAKEDFGDNVHVFKTEAECVEIPELKTRVWGVSFGEMSSSSAKTFPEIEKAEGVTDIILMHGDLTSTGSDSIYNPIDRSFIEGCGADYLALGHIHKRSEIKRIGGTYFAYPGSPEGRGFDECGDMGCYVGRIEDGAVEAEFKKTCIRRLFRLECDISAASDNLEICDIVKKEILSCGNENDMFKISLTGRIGTEVLNLEILKNEIKKLVYYAEISDNTRADLDIKSLAEENNLCGGFVRIMNKKIESLDGEERLIAEEALLLGADALLGGGV